jgi:Flp pilus assembly protein TadG
MIQRAGRARGRRARGDDGSAVVEFAFVGVLLFTLVFGIISFGLILSFKQDMTRAAAEGARAGAVALPVAPQTFADAARADADAAVDDAVKEFGGSFSGTGCAKTGMTCSPAVVAPCGSQPSLDCVTVTLRYDYENHPLYGRIPLISSFMPDTVEATSVARING